MWSDAKTVLRVAISARYVLPALITLLATAGCATTPRQGAAPTPDVVVHLDADGQVWFNGAPYAVNRFPAALKRVRVAHNQAIRIHIPDRKDKHQIVRISSALRTAGFTRFFFVSEPHAEATVSEPGRPGKPGTAVLAPTDPFK